MKTMQLPGTDLVVEVWPVETRIRNLHGAIIYTSADITVRHLASQWISDVEKWNTDRIMLFETQRLATLVNRDLKKERQLHTETKRLEVQHLKEIGVLNLELMEVKADRNNLLVERNANALLLNTALCEKQQLKEVLERQLGL